MDAAVAEVAVNHAVDVEFAHQRLEIAQVIRQVFGRNRGVLPAGPGQFAATAVRSHRRAASQTGAISADAPQAGRVGAGRVNSDGRGVGGRGDRSGAGHGRLQGLVAAHLDQQPGLAIGQFRDFSGARVLAQRIDQAAIHPLDRQRRKTVDQRHISRRLDHRGIAQHHQHRRGRHRDQPDLGS